MEIIMTEAAKKAPPIADAKIHVNGEYQTIGAQWRTSKAGVTSIKLEQPTESFILVNRTPKPNAKTAQPS
jgi:hypothetical protein